MRQPALACDHFKPTATKGRVTGESLRDFPIREGDHLLADRGYSTAAGIGCATQAGGRVTVRVNTGALAFPAGYGAPFDLLGKVSSLESARDEQSWPVRAVRKTEEAIRIAQEGIRKEARRKGRQVRPQTLEFARHVIVFATFPAADFSRAEVLEWQRLRWHVELVFKRFKQPADLGHLPKHDDESAKAWLYGKLLAALPVEKLTGHATAISPWGHRSAARLRPVVSDGAQDLAVQPNGAASALAQPHEELGIVRRQVRYPGLTAPHGPAAPFSEHENIPLACRWHRTLVYCL